MRCLASLAEWENLSNLCRTEWRKSEPHVRREMALIAAHAAWHMGAWDEMAMYVDTVDNPEAVGPNSHTPTGAFLRAVLCVRANQVSGAQGGAGGGVGGWGRGVGFEASSGRGVERPHSW